MASTQVISEQMRQNVRETWRIDDLKEHQELALKTVLQKRDCLVCVPTGGGKSLCFEALTTLFDACSMSQQPSVSDPLPQPDSDTPDEVLRSTVIVVSPLVALIATQTSRLNQLGIPAMSVCGAKAAEIESMKSGEYRWGLILKLKSIKYTTGFNLSHIALYKDPHP